MTSSADIRPIVFVILLVVSKDPGSLISDGAGSSSSAVLVLSIFDPFSFLIVLLLESILTNNMASQPFMSKEGEEVTFSFAPTPTYLFRLYTPKSAGRTNAEHVSPPAYLNRPKVPHRRASSCNLDLLQLPSKIAAWRLSDHLLWKCGGCCNLMSWSSSLLLVLQYALYRHEDWRDRSSLSEIFIIMIDTRGFPQRTFLRDLDALDYYPKFIKLDADWKKLIGWRVPRNEKYFGEYLTQGDLEIEGHCC